MAWKTSKKSAPYWTGQMSSLIEIPGYHVDLFWNALEPVIFVTHLDWQGEVGFCQAEYNQDLGESV
jgi:hypothetical protein